MVRTIKCKLTASTEEHSALSDTMQSFNIARNYLSSIAFETKTFRAYELHYLSYYDIRKSSRLPSQLVVRAIASVSNSYKLDTKTRREFKSTSSVIFDRKCFKLKEDKAYLTTTQGRFSFPISYNSKQRELLEETIGESTLIYRNGSWYLYISVKITNPEPILTKETIGVDFGIDNIATTSDNLTYSGEAVKFTRRRLKRIRALLQSKGTRSAKRHLKKINRKQSNFTTSTNHCISKQLTQKAFVEQKALALEDLKGIRERGNGLNKAMREALGSWSFFQLREFIEYKAQGLGVPIILINPAYTSQTCSECEHFCKENRKSQSEFKCIKCGLELNADFNAALNIKTRASYQRAYCSIIG